MGCYERLHEFVREFQVRLVVQIHIVKGIVPKWNQFVLEVQMVRFLRSRLFEWYAVMREQVVLKPC